MRDSDKGLKGARELSEKLANELADQLREANTGGVTRWLGLKERLDFGMIEDIENYRSLLKRRLEAKLAEESMDADDVKEKRGKAQNLLDALTAFEEDVQGNNKDNDNDKDNDNEKGSQNVA